MSAPLAVEPDISGPAAPPRANGELVFEAPWQARAFGMAVALLERDGASWDQFRRFLVPALAAQPDAPYYEALVSALEAYVAARPCAPFPAA